MTPAIRVTVIEGPSVTLRYDEITAQDVVDFNRAIGRPAAFAAMRDDPSTDDLDVAAALLWLGWRRAQPRLTFAQVASTVTFDNPVAIERIPDIGDE